MYNIGMGYIKFEWDKQKNETNIKKHGVSFEEAVSVFFDPEALIIADPDHSVEEERFVIMGLNEKLKLLVVCHCYRENEEIIRIISARKATSTEREWYQEG